MPISVIPFPNIDPVLISIGPFAIRWYALAYIFGVLLGWAYGRAIIRNEGYWAGPAPLTLQAFDDFIIWVTLGIILGGAPATYYSTTCRTTSNIPWRYSRCGTAACRFMADS